MQRFEILSDIVLILINEDSFDQKIKSALEAIGTYTGLSRIHILFEGSEGMPSGNIWEWIGEGIYPIRDELQNISGTTSASLKSALRRKGNICADDIRQLPGEIGELLESQGISSAVIFPLLVNHEIAGFIDFEECGKQHGWPDKDMKLFRIFAGLLSSAYELHSCQKHLTSAIGEQEAMQKFVKLFEDNPALMAITDLSERKFIDVNTAFLDKTGYGRDEVIGKTSDQIGLFALNDEQLRLTDKLIKSAKFKNVEMNVRCKDGKILNGLFSGEVIESQKKKYLLTVMVDITEQIILRDRLENKKNRLNNIIEGTGLGTWEWNIHLSELIINERWAEMVGYTLDDLSPVTLGTWEKLVHPDDLAAAYDSLRRHFERETAYYDCETRMKHRNGEWIWVHSRGKVIEWDSEGQPLKIFGTHSDITENKKMQERIRELSIRDFLTGVYNRRHIFERLETILAEYRREKNCFTVSIIDIDYFKNVNDNYGHLAGDAVLKEFAQIIHNNLRPYDLIGRYGGEEFIIVSINANNEQSRSTMERILNIIRDTTFVYRDFKIRLAFSCGISESLELDAESISAEKLLDKADNRLYMAKRTGRNRIVVQD